MDTILKPLVPLLLMTLCACGQAPTSPDADDSANTGDRLSPATQPPAVQPPASSPGQSGAGTLLQVAPGPPLYLVDASGASVYFVEKLPDSQDCDDICEDAWPPVVVNETQAAAGEGVDPNALAFEPRATGGHQATYHGHRLYRYAGDGGAGRSSGHGVRDKWGHWRLLTPHGAPLEQEPPATRRPASGGG